MEPLPNIEPCASGTRYMHMSDATHTRIDSTNIDATTREYYTAIDGNERESDVEEAR
jgi:hypothetical protein